MTRWRAFRLTEKISHELQTTTQASQLRCLSNLFLESWKQNLTSIGYPYWTVASFQFVFKIKDNWRERQLTVCNSVVAVPIVELPANVWTLKLVTASPWAPRSEKNTTKIIKTAFHVAVSTFNNGSQITSKCSKKKKKLILYDSFKKFQRFWLPRIPSSHRPLLLACCTTTDSVFMKYANRWFWSSTSTPRIRFKNREMFVKSDEKKKKKWRQKQINQVNLKPVKVTAI